MGAAIDVFEGAARAARAARRFAPVKTTDDLLVLRSDAYELTDDARVELAPERDGAPPFVDARPRRTTSCSRDFDARFPPARRRCGRASAGGGGRRHFGRDVVVRGSVEVQGPREIADGQVLGLSRRTG